MQKQKNNFTCREQAQPSAGPPASLDVTSRSVGVIAATEAPAFVYDWELGGLVREVLLMSGCQLPPTGQMPLLDSHDLWGTYSVIGSFRGAQIEGDKLVGRAYFTMLPEGDLPFTKVKEGHLDSFSIGYRIDEFVSIAANQSHEYEGRTFEGPLRLVTRWTPMELSVCPIGADPNAKARTSINPTNHAITEIKMSKKKVKELQRKKLVREDLPAATPDVNADMQAAADGAVASVEDVAAEIVAEIYQVCPFNVDGACNRGDGIVCAYDVDGACTKAGPSDNGSGDDAANAASDAAGDANVTSPTNEPDERKAAAAIARMCNQAGQPHLAASFISRGITPAQVGQTLLTRMSNAAPQMPIRGQVVNDSRDRFRAAAEAGFFMRLGHKLEKPAPGAEDFRYLSMTELARECLRAIGQPTGGDPRKMVGRALTTSDLPLLLEAGAERSLLEGFNSVSPTYESWTSEGSLNDFRPSDLVEFSVDNRLHKILEHEEYTYAKVTESGETVQLSTYGVMFAITRHAIINDDLNALTKVPFRMGEGAGRKVGDLVYAVFTENPLMGDGKPLFHADHGNIVSGAGGDPTVEKLALLEAAMAAQTDPFDEMLDIDPEYLIAPKALRPAMETFFVNEYIGSQAQPLVRNIYVDFLPRTYEGRLDKHSKTNWYVSARKDMGISRYYLNGSRVPIMESREGWNIDGREYKVLFDTAAKAISWRGLYKCVSS